MKKYILLVLAFLSITNAKAQWPKVITLGTGTTANTNTGDPTPYANYNPDYREVYLVRASELQAQGYTAGQAGAIRSVAFNVKTVQGAVLNNFTIKIKQTAATTLTTTPDNVGFTTVVGPINYTEVAGWNTHNFNAPFCWDGTSNLLIDICVTNASSAWTYNASVYNYVPFTNSAANRVSYYDYTISGSTLCGTTYSPSVSSTRPHMKFTIGDGSNPDAQALSCSSPGVSAIVGINNSVSLVIKNNGCSTFSTANVGYKWNNSAPVLETFSGSVPAGGTATHNFATGFTPTSLGYNSLKLWVKSPDGVNPDGDPTNDTLYLNNVFVINNPSSNPTAYTGNDFWMGFMQNNDNGASNPTPAFTQTLYLTASSGTANVTISAPLAVPGTVWSTNVSVTANNITTVVVPNVINSITMATSAANAVSPTGIHVVSNNSVPITVYGLSRMFASTDGYLGIPTNSLGKDYVIVAPIGIASSATGSAAPSELLIIATANNTTATIKLPAGVPAVGQAAGSTFTTPVMQAGQTFLVQSGETGGVTKTTYDLSGTIITSNNNIGVLEGTVCAFIPTSCKYCDHVNEMAIPSIAWGKDFYLANFAVKTSGDIVRVVNQVAGTTTFSFTGLAAQTLTGKGAYKDYTITGGVHINSNNPLYVVQMCKGGNCDNPITASDPFILNIIPSEQWGNLYGFIAPPLSFSVHYVNVIKKSANGKILLDGTFLNNASFSQITGTNYYLLRQAISEGQHTINGDSSFTAYVYGYNNDDSYGYPASGASVTPIAVPMGLLNFYGNKTANGNMLKWTTVVETNNDYFTLERSSDNFVYNEIGRVKGAGTTTKQTSYNFLDKGNNNGTSYYRLKQTDFNGEYKYSNIVTVESIAAITLSNIHPNPATDKINVDLYSAQEGKGILYIYDVMGQLVHSESFTSEGAAYQTIEINTNQLPTGVYSVTVEKDGEKVHQKFIKK